MKIIRIVSFLLLILFLSSCSNQRAEFETKYEVTYDESSDQTYIFWQGRIMNHSMYNIESIAIHFRLYHQGIFIKDIEQVFDVFIEHGTSLIPNLSGYTEGEIDEIRLVVWSASYDTFFGTYDVSLIMAIIALMIIMITSLILIFINDYELSDFFEWLKDEWFYFSIATSSIAIATTVYSFIHTHWGYSIIIGATIVIAFLLMLIAFAIKAVYDALV